MSANRITFALSLKRERDDISHRNTNAYVYIYMFNLFKILFECSVCLFEHYEKCNSFLTLCLTGFNRWLMSIFLRCLCNEKSQRCY